MYYKKIPRNLKKKIKKTIKNNLFKLHGVYIKSNRICIKKDSYEKDGCIVTIKNK